MFWNIIIAVVAALFQVANSWLGWRVTLATEPLSLKKRKLYDYFFVGFAIGSVICVALLAYRGTMEHAHLAVTDVKQAYFPDPFVVDQPLRAQVLVANVGAGPAKILTHYSRTYIRDDVSIVSQESAIEEFKHWMKNNPPDGGGNLLPPTQTFWFTSDGVQLSPEDQQNLVHGRRVFYVLSDIRFNDDFGTHEFENCQMMQPPKPNQLLGMQICKPFNDELRRFF